jgi:hypothetical protein
LVAGLGVLEPRDVIFPRGAFLHGVWPDEETRRDFSDMTGVFDVSARASGGEVNRFG